MPDNLLILYKLTWKYSNKIHISSYYSHHMQLSNLYLELSFAFLIVSEIEFLVIEFVACIILFTLFMLIILVSYKKTAVRMSCARIFQNHMLLCEDMIN